MDKIAVLKKTSLFKDLDGPGLKAFAGLCSERRLRRGETLFSAGEMAHGLYILGKGTISAHRGNVEGRDQIMHVEKAVTTLGEVPLFDDGPYPSTAIADEACELLFITKEGLHRLLSEHPKASLGALKLLAGRLRKISALAESLSLKEVDQRLAVHLFQEFQAGRLKVLKLPPHSVTAARLGTVREIVSRAFSKLEKEGLVKLDEHHNLTLLDKAGLKERSEK